MGDMFTQTGAWFSDEDPPLYRHDLWERWGPGALLTFLLLNPSIGGPRKFDPTNTRGKRRAIRLGYDGVRFLNAFAYITPHPKDLKNAARAGIDIVGPHNDEAIRAAALDSGMMVCMEARDGGSHG